MGKLKTKKRKKTRKIATILEDKLEAIIVLSLDGTIQSWNKGAKTIFGFTPAEVVEEHQILSPHGIGRRLMNHRARMIDAPLNIHRNTSGGMTVICALPVEKKGN